MTKENGTIENETKETGTKENGTKENGTKENGTNENGTNENGTKENETKENGDDKTVLLDPDILAKIERRLEDLGISKHHIEIDKGSMKGDNYLGVIAKLDIKGKTKDGEDKTLHWLTKSAPTNEHYRDVVQIGRCFAREFFIYHSVFPEFLKLQKDKNLTNPFENFIPLHLSCMEDCKECLVMENMKEHGFKMQDRFKPLDLDHTLMVMREYGRFHALSFALRDQKPEVFKKLEANSKDSFFSYLAHEPMRDSFVKNVAKTIDALDPVVDAEGFQKLKKIQPRALDDLTDVVNKGAGEEYRVLGHGDSWINNILFKYEDENDPEKPTDLLFLDYQLSRVGSPCLDLSYFIFTCTDSQLRRDHFDEFLEEYYSSLSSFLRELGGDPEKLFPRQALDDHMKRFSLYGIIMSLMVLFMMMSESEEVPDWSKMTPEEMKKSVDFTPKKLPLFEKRVRGVILDCVARGYL